MHLPWRPQSVTWLGWTRYWMRRSHPAIFQACRYWIPSAQCATTAVAGSTYGRILAGSSPDGPRRTVLTCGVMCKFATATQSG